MNTNESDKGYAETQKWIDLFNARFYVRVDVESCGGLLAGAAESAFFDEYNYNIDFPEISYQERFDAMFESTADNLNHKIKFDSLMDELKAAEAVADEDCDKSNSIIKEISEFLSDEERNNLNVLKTEQSDFFDDVKENTTELIDKMVKAVYEVIDHCSHDSWTVGDVEVSVGFGSLVTENGLRMDKKESIAFSSDELKAANRISLPAVYVMINDDKGSEFLVRVADHNQGKSKGIIPDQSHMDDGMVYGEVGFNVIISSNSVFDVSKLDEFLKSKSVVMQNSNVGDVDANLSISN